MGYNQEKTKAKVKHLVTQNSLSHCLSYWYFLFKHGISVLPAYFILWYILFTVFELSVLYSTVLYTFWCSLIEIHITKSCTSVELLLDFEFDVCLGAVVVKASDLELEVSADEFVDEGSDFDVDVTPKDVVKASELELDVAADEAVEESSDFDVVVT